MAAVEDDIPAASRDPPHLPIAARDPAIGAAYRWSAPGDRRRRSVDRESRRLLARALDGTYRRPHSPYEEGSDMRRCLIPVAVAMAALAVATPASAITGGEPDAGRHPYVALMQSYDANNRPLQVCTGALVSPTLFLTAGHCVAEPHATSHVEVWFVEDIFSVFDIDY